MAEMNDIIKLAVDGYKGTVEKYSVKQSQETLREALIECNNGKTTLSYKDIRDGKCPGLFSLLETILDAVIVDSLTEDEFFNQFVDFRNIALGDENVFSVEDASLFYVAEIAEGTQGIRRQRLPGPTTTPVPTTLKAIRIYEELNRVLAGRVDFNEMINRVGLSMRQAILNDIYSLWVTSTTPAAVTGGANMGAAAYFPVAGSYDEDTLLTTIAHVEAAAGGKTATLIGTKKALKAALPSIQSDGYKDEMHNYGFAGKFYGSPVVALPQRHKVGTTDFLLNDKVITIVAGDPKPIKCVYEGDPLIIMGDPLQNADLTQEYFYASRWGTGLVIANDASGIGCYTMT